ncbi:MAG: hypothetical protein KHW59_07990 [Clostridiales bacterium]|nr:hypothetical protein [Clostridiales bacterium]
MYELKTKPTGLSPSEVMEAISHPQKREDAKTLLKIFSSVAGSEENR